MVTINELRQAERIVFRIQSGQSVRTDPRSTVGRLVNRALQRQIDIQESLRTALAKGLLEEERFAESRARAQALKDAEQAQIQAQARAPPTQQFDRGRQIQPTQRELELGQSLLPQFREQAPSPTRIESQFLQSFPVSARGQPSTIAQQLETQVPFTPPQDIFERPVSTVVAVEKPSGFLGGLQFELGERRARGGRVEQLFVGAGVSAVGTLQFGQQLLTDPFGTTGETFGRVKEIGGRVIRGDGFPSISRTIRQEPEFATGFLLGEIATFKGLEAAPKGILKVSDIARTRGLTELPAAQIIAPEFFAGQTFPAIRRGQTAGELLTEFRPILPGETRPAGFTAAPKPFAAETVAARGTSELPGVFQSPLVSPRFLRISGEAERQLFSTRIFDTFRPSIVRITPEDIRLAPGVAATQKQLASNLRETRKFFEEAPKGESIIPFLKTEKEAILPFGTPLALTDKRFFVRFEGRRVPIFEFEARGAGRGRPLVEDIGRLPSVEDISRSLSRGITRERGIITPVTSIGLLPSRSSLSASISRGSLPSLAPSISPPRRRPSTTPLFSLGGISSGAGRGFDSFRPIFPPGAPPVTTPPVFDLFEDPFAPRPPRRRRRDVRKKKPKKKKKGRRITTPTRVSFTGIVLGVEEAAFVDPRFGVSPLTIRGRQTGRRRSRPRGRLTDL